MKICSLDIVPLAIPFVEQFAHATKTRDTSDAVLFKVRLNDGTVGWGETLVRPYLTGESVDTLCSVMSAIAPQLADANWKLAFSAQGTLAQLAPVTETLDKIIATQALPAAVRAWNGLRCGLELALLDALLRAENLELANLLPPVRKEVLYSGVITAGEATKSLKVTRQMKQLGISAYKLKITAATPVSLIHEIRELIGSASLRLDANAAFTLDAAIRFCKAIEPFDIAAIEEPLAERSAESLAQLQKTTKIAVMADESLITLQDAAALVERQATRMFNVRLAKCGGLAKCLELGSMATQAGLDLQLGSLVGETAILSAVGRALAAHMTAYRFVEGSYGTLLLKEDIARQSVRFGFGGKAPLLRGPGLGIDIDENVIRKYTKSEPKHCITPPTED